MNFGSNESIKFECVSISNWLESKKGSHSRCDGSHDNFPNEGDWGWANEFRKSEGLNEVVEFIEAVRQIVNLDMEEL